MKEKVSMFLTYIEFFHKLHTKHLKRFSNKIQLMYTHITTDIKFDESIEISKSKKKESVDDFTNEPQNDNEMKLTVEEFENNDLKIITKQISNHIIDDEESVKLINDILENNDDKSVVHNNTPVSINSTITDENVYDNFKNISQSCDDLLSKDNKNVEDNKNIGKSVVSEVSDISDDVSVMSEFIIDEPDNPTFSSVAPSEKPKPKATRGRKKKN